MIQTLTHSPTEKADSDLVRRQNRRIVLDALRREGNLARVELGRATGLSPASITAISTQLIDERIIQEVELPMGAALTGKRGRPIVKLALRADATHVLAVKISIDDVVLVLADFQGTIVGREEVAIPTYDADPAHYGGKLAQAIAHFIKGRSLAPYQISRVGIAVQGLADVNNGTILWSPAFSAREVPLVAPIAEALGVPVTIGNDANMMAEGFRAGAKRKDVTAVVFTGYGVGMGLIINGEVYHGASGSAAEFGHMNHIPGGQLCRCGKRGCIEAYSADYAILRTAGLAGSAPPLAAVEPAQMRSLMDDAEQGDATALGAIALAGEALGYGLARMIAILNPNRIVVAGLEPRALKLIEPALRNAIDDGVVEALSRGVSIELMTFDVDMIMRGTIDALLRNVDREVFAVGTIATEVAG